METKIIGRHLVVSPPDPDQFKQVFPGARFAEYRGKTVCAVPYHLQVVKILRNLGIKAPSPIRHRYRWAGRYKPYTHQIETSDFLTLNKRAYLLSGMGTGKTLSAAWAADYLMKQGIIKRALIVSPLSTLERAWGDTLFTTFPHRSFAVLHGSREKRAELLKQEHDFYIINPDGLGRVLRSGKRKALDPNSLAAEIIRRTDINLIIIDEVAAYRNAQTDRWYLMRQVVTPQRWCWGLTGTPTPNSYTDAYGQCKLITPERVPKTFTGFRDSVMMQVSQYKWIPRQGGEDIVHQAMQPAIRFRREDCIDLPPTIYSERETTLTKEQHYHYQELLKESITDIQGREVTAVNAGVLLQKLCQTVCGVVYSKDGSNLELDVGHRLTTLKEIIEECEAKVIVFVPLTGVLRMLERELAKTWTVAVIDGSVSAGKRNDIFSDFQHGKDPRILVANPGAMSHGLTLTAADTIIWYAPVASNEIYEQANARIVRPGQKRKTHIVHIEGSPVERKIYASLQNKQKMQNIVLELLKNPA